MTCCSSCSLHKRPSRRCACSYKFIVALPFLSKETRLASLASLVHKCPLCKAASLQLVSNLDSLRCGICVPRGLARSALLEFLDHVPESDTVCTGAGSPERAQRRGAGQQAAGAGAPGAGPAAQHQRARVPHAGAPSHRDPAGGGAGRRPHRCSELTLLA